MTALEHLVLVAGHAIPRQFDDLHEDSSWYLKPFQQGEGRFYVEHALHGVRLAGADPQALLVFSGGQSDIRAGARGEGQGYWLIADRHGWLGMPEVRERATTEDFSLDSYQNLLFGIARFGEYTGHYPTRVTVMGWEFKRRRFDFHRETLRFPSECFSYVGVNNPERLSEAAYFEELRLKDFQADPYGTSEKMNGKRQERNPFRRQAEYATGCPELAGLLNYRGPEMYTGPLPW